MGFSLIELAIVIFIVSLLVGGLLVPLATSVEQSERENTSKQLEDIKEALYAYSIVNGRLPCPDCTSTSGSCSSATENDGVEDLTGSSPTKTCARLYGNLPWTTIGIGEEDAWGQRYTYKVTQAFAYEIANTTATAPCIDNANTAFDLCTVGDIDIKTDAGSASIDVAEDVAAIVISHGRDFFESSFSTHQDENNDFDTDNIFVSREFSRNYTGGLDFDDIIIWISPNILKNNLVNAEKLP